MVGDYPASQSTGSANTERTLVFTFQPGNHSLAFVDDNSNLRPLISVAPQ